jgi:NADPH-dependent glutamate synthase beta subunit-like oxidoreductase
MWRGADLVVRAVLDGREAGKSILQQLGVRVRVAA